MFDGEEFAKAIPLDLEKNLQALPYDVARKELYSACDLFDGFNPSDPASVARCLDARIAAHVAADVGRRPSPLELRARTMHDAHVRIALYRLLDWYEEKRVVGVMGGHALQRTDADYRRVVDVAKTLTERGRLVISGGGPGAMEATHVGAWLAGRTSDEVDRALAILATAPSPDHPRWLATAFETMRAYPQQKSFVSVSIPTWHFSSEPPTPFATYIAKFFENSLREDVLLTEAYGGIVVMPGGAGTLQEVFQDAVQDHYLTHGRPSPMVFVGRAFWSEQVPVYPLLEKLIADGRYKNMTISLVETAEEIVAALG